jgi:cation diffusion facilitator CzcD-associated flavoprotein CzcO
MITDTELRRTRLSEQVVVIGAGPAGVSVALSLKDRGVCPLLVDRADQIASSWRSRYDRLKLNTGRQFSHLPNRKYPPTAATTNLHDRLGKYPSRNSIHRYW